MVSFKQKSRETVDQIIARFSKARNVFDSDKWVALMLGLPIVFGAISGIYIGNPVVMFGLASGLLIALALAITALVALRKSWRFNAWADQHGARLVLYMLCPIALLVSLTSFIFGAPFADTGKDKRWFLGDKLQRGIFVAIPFVQNIWGVPNQQDVSFEAFGTTMDGKRVRGLVTAEFRLSPDDALIAATVAKNGNPTKDFQGLAKANLSKLFERAVGRRELSALQPDLVLEYGTGSGADTEGFRRLGIEWSGTLRVTDLHPYFGK